MVLKVKVSPDLIAGDADVGYGRVADVLRGNLTSGQEIGASVAVYRDGVKVVDLWGGYTKSPLRGIRSVHNSLDVGASRRRLRGW
jgi:hypothetical protein